MGATPTVTSVVSPPGAVLAQKECHFAFIVENLAITSRALSISCRHIALLLPTALFELPMALQQYWYQVPGIS